MTLSLAAQILSVCAVYFGLVAWIAHDRRKQRSPEDKP
jgi:hypothetical protein